MRVLGLGFTQHECSAALVINGEVTSAIARERVSRIKRDGSAWGSAKLDLKPAIDYCLASGDLKWSDIDLVVFHHYFHKSAEEFKRLLAAEGGFDFFSAPTIALPHHFAHACCAFYLSPFEDAAVLVADGAGGPAELIVENCEGPEAIDLADRRVIVQNIDPTESSPSSEYESFYEFRSSQWHTLRKIVGRSNGGVGAVYSRASRLLFGDGLDSGKTMGLSSFATPGDNAMFLAKSGPDDAPYFHGELGPQLQLLEQEIKEIIQSKKDSFQYEDKALQYYSACLQHETEEALIEYARWLRVTSGLKNLCLCGGVALNCVANSRIWDEAGFERVFVPPCPGDDGIAMGCALFGAALHNELKNTNMPVFGGRKYQHDPTELEALGLQRIAIEDDLYEVVAKKIAGGAVIAWFQEGSEFGPRALGHRSFLADPRDQNMKDHLNIVVKRRGNLSPICSRSARRKCARLFHPRLS